MGVSFVIPTKNNEDTLKQCLESIVMQSYEPKEIIVVDGDSTDSTREIAESYGATVLFGGNIGEARNIGVASAQYEFIAFIDSDMEIPHENWLRGIMLSFKAPVIGGVWMLGLYKDDYPSIARYSIISHPMWKAEVQELTTYENYIPFGGSMVLRKEAILKVGGVNPLEACEDLDLTKRICDAGYTFIHSKNSVYHLHVKTFNDYMKKYNRDITATLSGGRKVNKLAFIKNNTIMPIIDCVDGLISDRDVAWLWHPVICYYKNIAVLKKLLKR
jgi:glycosyltransferase involved in cell wall biosynthesis